MDNSTNANRDEFWIEEAGKMLNNFLSLMSENDGFTSMKESNTDENGNTNEKLKISISKKNDSNSSLHIYKRVGIIKTTAIDLLDLIYDFQRRREFDLLVADCYVLKTVNENVQLAYMAYPSPFPFVGSRDFVFIRVLKKESDKKFIVATSSVQSDDLMPPKSGFIRADAKISGWMIEELEENSEKYCMVSCALQVDPKGWIPAVVVNALGPSKAIDSFQALRRAAAKSNKK